MVERLVARVKAKIVAYSVPEPCEKYLSLKLDAQTVGTEEYTEMSELMEDLYKMPHPGDAALGAFRYM